MRVLITGGAGFIGSTMAARLAAEGHDVVVIDDLSTGRLDNLSSIPPERLTFIAGSILDRELLRDAMAGCSQVFHLAAAVGVFNIVNDPIGSLRTNLHGTDNVLDACLEVAPDARLLVASTSEVYGKHTADRLNEDADRIYGSPLKSRWSYAEAKALDELLTLEYVRQHGLAATIVRPFNTVGPGQSGRYGMVVPRLVAQAVRDEPLTVYGDGRQTRVFCHVEDVVEGMLRLNAHPDAVGHPFNLGGVEEISIAELAARIIELSGSDSMIRFVPYDEAYGEGYEDMRRRMPDTTRARELVGFVPTYSLDDIIHSVIEHERRRLTAPLLA